MSEWISAKDRQPEDGVDVLVVCDGQAAIGSYDAKGNGGKGFWWTEAGSYSPVTHWMPLPPLPEIK